MNKLFDEVTELCDECSHRAALRIHAILSENPDSFTGVFGKDLYQAFLTDLGTLSGNSRGRLNAENFKDDFQRITSLLKYYLNKVIS